MTVGVTGRRAGVKAVHLDRQHSSREYHPLEAAAGSDQHREALGRPPPQLHVVVTGPFGVSTPRSCRA